MAYSNAFDDEVRQTVESIISSGREPLIVLDQDLMVVFASPSFYEVFKTTPEKTLGRLFYDLGNKQWAVPQLKELLETRLPREKTIADDAVEHEFVDLGRRTMLLNAREIFRKPGKERLILLAIEDVTGRKQAEGNLQKIQWMLSSQQAPSLAAEHPPEGPYAPPYGDLTELNTSRKILDAVGKDTLENIAGDFLELLETSVAIYEKNGDYALGLFSSDWCRLMDQASYRLCETDDRAQALICGKWLCHESCWNTAKQAIDTAKPVDTACEGGIRLYAAPISAGGEVIGTINVGYADPPTDVNRLSALAIKYGLDVKDLTECSNAYESRPPFIIALAKRRIHSAAHLIGQIVERKQAEDALRQSENYYRAIFETSASAIFILEEDTTISHVNSNFQKLLGYSKQEVEGKKSWTEFIHPDDLEGMKENHYLRRREPRAAPLDYEFRFFVRSGELRHGFLTVDMIPGTSQSVVSLIDITGRKRTEEARRKSEERYRTILNEMSEGYQEVDLSGNFTFFNEAFLKIFGYARDEMMGTNFKHYAAEEAIAKKVYRRYNEMFKTGGTIQNSEWDIIRKDGERRTLEYYASVVKDSKDIPTGFRGIVRDITDRKRAEKQMRLQSLVLDQIEDRVTVTDLDGIITYVNEAEIHALGYPREELIGASIEKYGDNPDQSVTQQEILEKTLKHGAWRGEVVNRTIDGREIVLDARTQMVLDDQGNRIALAGIATDITERKRAENEKERLHAQLSQAQKMESVGRLAGGVAHDFNNKLAVINGYAEIVMERVAPSDPLHKTIQEIHTAGKQSAAIVRQLLAFARKQTISPVQLDLNDTIAGMLKMLQRLISENINLEWHPGSNLAPVKMDPSQVDQIMVNLAVNARDAISDVGKLSIETQNTVVDTEFCKRNPEAIPGRYVMLAVSDDGCGMEKEVRDQLFDPYFTTKEIGKGTGLGLPTIYGIVKQNNGFIKVYSEPGEGTTFKLYFPSHEEAKTSLYPAKESTGQIPTGTETILVVEDEKTILEMSRQMLERLGYTVKTAGSPSEALQIGKQYDGPIHLLLTDMIMPEMNGRDLSSRLSQTRPGVKTLYMSGYTADVIAHHGVLDEGLQFIQKPFSLRDLAFKVREVMDPE